MFPSAPLVFAAALAAPLAAAAAAEPVVAVVKVAKPWYAPQALIARKMRDTVPQYERAPGLVFKAYSFAQADGAFGGLYLWRDRAAADAWFDAAWFERVRRERGVEGEVRFFAAPVVLDNGTPEAAAGSVGTLVTIATPAGVSRERLVEGFNAALPEYRRVDGLLRKYFIITDDGRFGGVYLWRDEAAAKRWFDDAWHQRVRQTYGGEARIEWFDTPVFARGPAADVK